MSQRLDIDGIKEKIKGYLPQYLTEMGHTPSTRGAFRCINPDHSDTSPSCSIIPNTDDKMFHCFSCNVSGNIFHAAGFLESKPMSGQGFIADNLLYLAKKYGIEVPELNLTEDELYEMDVYQAYADAASIIRTPGKISDLVKAWLTDRGWNSSGDSPLRRLGVGSIASYDDYTSRMTKNYKHDLAFLEQIDLTRKSIFNVDAIIFTIKDEHGAPVGFSARNLRYEEQKESYTKAREALLSGAQGPETQSQLETIFKPSKYYNTGDKCPIYHKSRRLFNFNIAKKSTPPLYVFEGYSDVVTAYMGGLRNAVSIGSVAFTKDHLELILTTDPPIKHVIFVLDADKAGNDGTRRFVELLETAVGGHVGLRAEIVVMPEGSDDPDAFIRKYPTFEAGARAFRELPKTDIFTWKIQQGMSEGQDPLSLAETAIPLIVNEANFLIRMDMTQKLAKVTGVPQDGLWREVMRMVDSESSRIDEEKNLIARRTIKELGRNTKDLQATLQSALHQTEMVEKRRTGYDPVSTKKAVDYALEKAANATSNMELLTGFHFLDKAINGLPKEECFISAPGKPNQGKSTFFDNLTIGLLQHNKDVQVFFHTVDDSLGARLPRLMGAKFNYPSEYFKRAGYWLKNLDKLPHRYRYFDEVYQQANAWLNNELLGERLIVADVAYLSPQLPALELWIRSLRAKFPNRHLVVLGDNFHLYDIPGMEAGEAKTREMSMFVKRLTTEHHCTILMTTELPKASLKPGDRPRIANIKGTSGIAYDANANFGIYNDMKDFGDVKCKLFWQDHDAPGDVLSNGDMVVAKKPVIEVVIDKSKISDFDGSVFFRLDPVTGRMTECEDGEQKEMKHKAYGD